jgi:hypothetical protein
VKANIDLAVGKNDHGDKFKHKSQKTRSKSQKGFQFGCWNLTFGIFFGSWALYFGI